MKLIWILLPLCLLSTLGFTSEENLLKNQRQTTFAGKRSGEAYYRTDGKWLVFQSERDESNPFYQIYLMDLQSGETKRVSPGIGKTTCSWVHPKEKRVLFSSTHLDSKAVEKQKKEIQIRNSGKARKYSWDFDENYDLFSTNFKGKFIRQLTKERGYDAEAAFSPDGKWIVFASNRKAFSTKLSPENKKAFTRDPAYMIEIYKMKSDGSDVIQLTDHIGYDGGPFFSSDGTKITWRRFSEDGHTAEIFVMNSDGSSKKAITKMNKMSWAPYFHPSGDYLIFSTNAAGGYNFELYIVDAEGKHKPVRVTQHPGFDGLPVFTPNGQQLSWTSTRVPTGKAQVFTADWDDIAARKLLGIKTKEPILSLSPQITIADLKSHVSYIASEELNGRMTGSQGEKLAKDYIVRLLKQYGYQGYPNKNKFLYPFKYTSAVKMGSQNTFQLKTAGVNKQFKVGQDWTPLAISASKKVKSSGIVFAGYGIVAAKTEEFKSYDSYIDLNVEGKWVVVFRYTPENVKDGYREYLNRFSNIHHKAMLAREKGAVGLIILSGPNAKVKNQLIGLKQDSLASSGSLPVISVKDSVIANLVKKGKLREYQKELDSGRQKHLNLADATIVAQTDLTRTRETSYNIVAKLGTKSRSKHGVLILGGHVDHLGLGKISNSLAKKGEKNKPHLGADDNASGVASILEVAHRLSILEGKDRKKFKRDIVVAFWSGEELGILGSNSFVNKTLGLKDKKKKNPIFAYLNLDMVGRLKDKLLVQGLGSSSDWPIFLEKISHQNSLNLLPQNDPYLPTDSTSFYLAGIPSLTFFTGAHSEYHTPRDTVELINFEGLKSISEFVFQSTLLLASQGERLRYSKLKAPQTKGGRGSIRIYLGTIPDYANMDAKGVLLAGVQEGGPAQRAGLKSGDLIVNLAGRKIENIYDYTNILKLLRPGRETMVHAKRGEKIVKLKLVPQSRD